MTLPPQEINWICEECGGEMVKTGDCLTCPTCGNSTEVDQ